MRILIHPRTIAPDFEVRSQIAESLQTALEPIRSRLDRIDVYLTDVERSRGAPAKRCRVVAYLPADQPVVVSSTDRDPMAAVNAAASRCRRSVRNRLDRQRDRRRRTAVAF